MFFKITTPVVLIPFIRPEKTQRVFDEIRRARPEKLFVLSDGPRNASEWPKVKAVRAIIDNQVDWPCQVFKRYPDRNLGCKDNIASGITWVFEHVEEAIILEDDCLPDQSFFLFCQELLEKYRNEPRIMQISGYNFASRIEAISDKSYFFSNIGMIWGWATWKRAWQYYDVNISNWPEIKRSGILKNILGADAIVDHYYHLFDNYYAQKIDSWDSQWFLARWLQGGLSAVSKNNLVQNIGFDKEATHNSIDPGDARAHVLVKSVEFPLVHPNQIVANDKADAYMFKHYLSINRFFDQKLLWFMKKRVPALHAFLKRLKEQYKRH